VLAAVLAQKIPIRIHFPHDASPFACTGRRISPWHLVRCSARSTKDAAGAGSSSRRAVSLDAPRRVTARKRSNSTAHDGRAGKCPLARSRIASGSTGDWFAARIDKAEPAPSSALTRRLAHPIGQPSHAKPCLGNRWQRYFLCSHLGHDVSVDVPKSKGCVGS
jgi:hypothetical protein